MSPAKDSSALRQVQRALHMSRKIWSVTRNRQADSQGSKITPSTVLEERRFADVDIA